MRTKCVTIERCRLDTHLPCPLEAAYRVLSVNRHGIRNPVFGVNRAPVRRLVHSGARGGYRDQVGDAGAGDDCEICRAYFAQNKPIKTICRELRVSRKVVRKVIRSQATEFRYERGRQPLPRIDPWRDQLDGRLLENEGKPVRERLTRSRIFEELCAIGYEGSYDAIGRYTKRWRTERGAATAEAYVPLSFAPGEAYQFDWSVSTR
jgi:hypothetical protein